MNQVNIPIRYLKTFLENYKVLERNKNLSRIISNRDKVTAANVVIDLETCQYSLDIVDSFQVIPSSVPVIYEIINADPSFLTRI